MTIQDARSGEIVASLSQNGSEEDLLDLVDDLGAQLRRSLGVEALSTAEERAMRTARPAGAQAARLYAEGMEKLSRYETLAATALLEQARDADPENALIRAELATAWRALGWQARAEEAAKEAFQRSGGLGYEPRRRVEARYYETTRQWDLAAGIYRELWDRFPDDLEYGLGLERAQLRMGNAQTALATLARLRAADEPWSSDPRIDLAAAEASLSLGDFVHGIEAAVRAQRKGEALGAPIIAARGLHFQGTGLRSLGRLAEARTAGERASGLFRKAGDLASAAAALITVGNVQTQQGDLEGARRSYEEIAAIGQAIGNEETRGTGLSNLGVTLSERGDLAGAREHYEQALEIFRRTGSQRRAAAIAGNLARVDQRLGHRAQARALLVETAATLRELGDRSNEAAVLASLAVLSLEEGNLPEASDLAARALAIHQEIGEISGVAVDRGTQGQVLALRGDLPAARRELEAAAASLDEQGETMEAARQRIELARVLVAAGEGKTGEAMARRALAGLGAKPALDDEVAARSTLAAALLGQGRPADAAAALEQASPSLAACENPVRRLQASLVAARVHAAQEKSHQAARELRAILGEAESSGLRPLASEARRLLGTIEAGAPQLPARPRLNASASIP